MNLNRFLSELLIEGNVTLRPGGELSESPDKEAALQLLREAWQHQAANLPTPAPDFHPGAALWAAEFLMHALYLAVDRNQGAEVVQEKLRPFSQEMNAAATVSADLCLRQLPRVLKFARALAPEDPLVVRLKETLRDWPYSGIGWEEREKLPDFPEDPFLQRIWLDRIIVERDAKLAAKPEIYQRIAADLGNYTHLFWPQFAELSTETETTIENG